MMNLRLTVYNTDGRASTMPGNIWGIAKNLSWEIPGLHTSFYLPPLEKPVEVVAVNHEPSASVVEVILKPMDQKSLQALLDDVKQNWYELPFI